MGDYGRELLFGSFLTPTSARPEHVVDLAVLCERLGLDLVTFQDHPYQPAFLDTWTLLGVVIARTSTIHVSANVTSLPLRPPAVLARSVASLDLLSGGRVELGLGAGAFWDGIEAMGGRRLTPGDAVRALEEAISVIRQLWDVAARGGVRVDGEFYRVIGAKRGPAPAHEVPIWLGAYKPRMLALTGRTADGWLPSLSYLRTGDLAAGNVIIDDAAEQAGRSPAAVRRLVNVSGEFSSASRGPLQGPAEQWAEELAEMALTDGVSAFILAADEPDDLRRFAAEVAPAVRDTVAAERAAARGSGATPAGAAVTEATRGALPPAGPTHRPAVARTSFEVVATPPPQTRRSSARVWDESTRPSGPERDPGRVYSSHDQASGKHLIDVHDALRRELEELDDLVQQVAAGIVDAAAARSHIATMTMRQNNWTLGTYCESYCRIVTTHHTLEDQGLLPHLRRADPRLDGVIDRLQEEHQAIHGVLEGVDEALVALVSTPNGVSALRGAVDLLSDTLLSHFSYEEQELVEPIARLGIQ